MSGIRSAVAATVGTLVVSLVGVPGSPAAAAPVPVVTLPPEVDRPAFYEKQTVCDPAPKPGTSALADLLVRTYGAATVYHQRSCTSSTSEHFDGRALDWMRSVRVASERAQVEDFLAWALATGPDGTPHAMARRLGIMYLIWDNRMIRMYDVGRGWTNYRNCLDPANAGRSLDTSCHRNHLHISMSWDGAAGMTSWYTGRAQTQLNCSSRSTSARPGTGTPQVVAGIAAVPGAVRVRPTTILDTRAGSGAGLGGSCRVLAGRSLFPVAAPAGVVPTTARAVVLSVSSASNAPARLSVWSSGAARPYGQVATPIGSTSATLVVPLASDRTVAVSPSLGAANLTVRVIGYLPATPATPVAPPPVAPSPPPVVSPPTTPVAELPGKPRKVRTKTKPGATWVRTKWKAPRSDGGAPILRYRVEALKTKKKGAAVAGSCTVGPATRSCRIKELPTRRKYWMSVSVWNEVGGSWAPRKRVRMLSAVPPPSVGEAT